MFYFDIGGVIWTSFAVYWIFIISKTTSLNTNAIHNKYYYNNYRTINLPKSLLEKIDDASTELMMGSGSTVMLRLGDALFESSEEDATEFCETEVERYQSTLDGLTSEMGDVTDKMDALKKILYGRFGKSINLEEK